MTGCLVWVPSGCTVTLFEPDPIDGGFERKPEPPTAADIDALVTGDVLMRAWQSAPCDLALRFYEIPIKAALRELLGVKP